MELVFAEACLRWTSGAWSSVNKACLSLVPMWKISGRSLLLSECKGQEGTEQADESMGQEGREQNMQVKSKPEGGGCQGRDRFAVRNCGVCAGQGGVAGDGRVGRAGRRAGRTGRCRSRARWALHTREKGRGAGRARRCWCYPCTAGTGRRLMLRSREDGRVYGLVETDHFTFSTD